MGSMFTQIIVKGPQQSEIADYLRERGRSTLVGPTVNEYTILSDQASQRFEVEPLEELCAHLSHRFSCPGLAFQYYSDDVLSYTLYICGTLSDKYNSKPSYFDFNADNVPPKPPMGGDVDKIATAFNLSPNQAKQANIALHTICGNQNEFQVTNRHAEILAALASKDRDALLRISAELQREENDSKKATIRKPRTVIPALAETAEAQWRYERLLRALGCPKYAIRFGYDLDGNVDYDRLSVIHVTCQV